MSTTKLSHNPTLGVVEVKDEAFERLPRYIVPVNYDLRIKPDLDLFTFDGAVTITINVTEEGDGKKEVRLHASELAFKEIRLYDPKKKDEEDMKIESIHTAPSQGLLMLKLAKPLTKGQTLCLSVAYMGTLNDRMTGFYRSRQQDGTMAATCHFEAVGARLALPCWDEPIFRSTFHIRLSVKKGQDLVALSNMPETSRQDASDPDYDLVEFQPTPKMPSYLVCWSVGQYDHITGQTSSGLPVRVFTPRGRGQSGRLALWVATKAVDYYSEFFDTPYSLPKMDLVSVADFTIGAMENWGLLTFREACLLFDGGEGAEEGAEDNAKGSSINTKMNVALIVAHEVAHQWFGNLVTIEWWTHLWLKEGYATWIEYLCVDKLFPSWNIWTQFLTDCSNSARALDSLATSHPIEVEIDTPDRINEVFDNISYDKGASVIRMLYCWLGEDAFKKGMKNYLDRKALDNATTEDLWAALGDTLPEKKKGSVLEVMSGWTKEMGYPVLSVKDVKWKEDDKTLSFRLRQDRFRVSDAGNTGADAENGSSGGPVWKTPLFVSTFSGKHKEVKMLEEREQTFSFSGMCQGDEWLNLNSQANGYYRVQYPADWLRSFHPGLLDGSLPEADRINLLNDQLALAQAGRVSTVDLLELIQNYRQDKSNHVWEAVRACLFQLRLMLRGSDISGDTIKHFNSWVRWLVRPTYERLGWSGIGANDHHTRLLQSLAVGVMLGANDGPAKDKGRQLFEKYSGELAEHVKADLHTPVYTAALSTDTVEGTHLKKLLQLAADDRSTNEDKRRMYAALGAARDSTALKAVLAFSLSKDVRPMDTRWVLTAVALGSRQGRDATWAFFKDNVAEFSRRSGFGSNLTRMIKAVAGTFATVGEADEVAEFFRKNPFPGAAGSIRQVDENIRVRAKWAGRDLEAVKDFLSKHDNE